MGFSKMHHQVEGVKELEATATKWVIAGIAIRAPLKSISTKPRQEVEDEDDDDDDSNSPSTTPKAKESKIPERLPCPPAPRKRRPTPTCHFNGVREFFNPPELETVFVRHVERAN